MDVSGASSISISGKTNTSDRGEHQHRIISPQLSEHGSDESPLHNHSEEVDWNVHSHHNNDDTNHNKTDPNSPASSPGSEGGLADGVVGRAGSSSRGSSMSGDGGGDTGSHGSSAEVNSLSSTSVSRRKRKSIPVKRPSSNDADEMEDDESANLKDKNTKRELDQGKDLSNSITVQEESLHYVT